jgi:hypothetical protein
MLRNFQVLILLMLTSLTQLLEFICPQDFGKFPYLCTIKRDRQLISKKKKRPTAISQGGQKGVGRPMLAKKNVLGTIT